MKHEIGHLLLYTYTVRITPLGVVVKNKFKKQLKRFQINDCMIGLGQAFLGDGGSRLRPNSSYLSQVKKLLIP